MKNLKQVLMDRDGLTSEEADDEIDNMKSLVLDGEDLEELLLEIGLEPDYVFDLLD